MVVLCSCLGEQSSYVAGGNLKVHFTDPKDKPLAKSLALFWKNEKLITGKKQDIKLIRTEQGYDLCLISPTRKTPDQLSFDELKALNDLEVMLGNQVFKDKLVQIVVTDEKFKPLFRPTNTSTPN